MICTVVGARPNFMKMAPVIRELRARAIPQLFVHTGQHYSDQMSKVFFQQLNLPQPDVYLGVGSGTHAEQTARIMTAFEHMCRDKEISCVIVAGDVNSTLAAALAAAKLNIPVIHIEAGLRSFDRRMPEEINRILTDHISDVLFTTEPSANENLSREGIDPDSVFFVGNTMIDTLLTYRNEAAKSKPWITYNFTQSNYGVITLHRPSNVDDPKVARKIADALAVIARQVPLIFPIHPRSLLKSGEIWRSIEGITLVEPLGYLEFVGLMTGSRIVITDSGGIQEETTVLGIPCMTIRENTERPITISQGTNRLVKPETTDIVRIGVSLLDQVTEAKALPPLWDGNAATRIVDTIVQWQEQSHLT